MQGILGPIVFGIASSKLAMQARVVPIPKTLEIGGDLHRALVGRQQMQHQRFGSSREGWPVALTEEVLQSRLDPRGSIALVVHR
jgi:hypothetical protein